MKLVTKANTTLGPEGGKWLKDLLDTSLEKDKDYFSFMSNLRNLATGEHWKNIRGVKKSDIKMVVNLAHAHVRTLVPTLFFQNPSVDCAPTAPQHSGKEQTWNGVINNTLDKIGFAEEIKKAVLDSVIYPEGVVKDVINLPEGANSETGSSGPAVWLTKGSPIHVRIQPTQLIVDYLSADRDVDNARFVAIRYRKPLAELKKHPIYGKNISEELRQKTKIPTTGNMVTATIPDSDDWDDEKVLNYKGANEELRTIYEVWIHQLIAEDGKYECYQQMCVLLEGQDKPIRELTPWETVMGKGFNKVPITRLVLNPIPDRVPVSELGVWQNMQMALNWLITRITKLVENDRLLYAADPSKIVDYQKFKQLFNSGPSRQLVEVNSQGALELLQPSFVGRDNYTLVNLIQQYIQQVSGIGQNRRGGSGIRTATEASLVDEGTKIKTDEKVDEVQKFLRKIITKTAMMIRSLTAIRGSSWVFRVGGDTGSVKWVNFTPEEMDWMPEVRIRVNSFRKMDSSQEMQKLGMLLQTAIGLFQLYGPSVRVDLLFARMLESAGIYDSGKIVGDQDKQQMLATVELAGMIAGVPTPVLESHNHAAHLQVDEAFKQSEYGQQLMAAAPELADRLAQHDQEHMQWLQILQEKAAQVQASQNPFAAAGMSQDAGNEQAAANQLTSGDRTAVQSIPGGNGEFA